MLPIELHGPGKVIAFESPDAFLSANRVQYPNLDPDFILQICFEHPARFDALFPGFEPSRHEARRVRRTAGWVYENVRYDDNQDIDFWFSHFDSQFSSRQRECEIFTHMVNEGEWPFPPVIIEAAFGATLGATRLGKPYHLIEGTHRVSYLRRMVQLRLVTEEREVWIIEVTE